MKKYRQKILLLIWFLILSTAFARFKSREQIPVQYRWDLSDLYSDGQAWDHDRDRLAALADSINLLLAQYNTNDLPVRLYQCHEILDRARVISQRLYRYAQCQCDTDTRNQEYQKKLQQVQMDFHKFNSQTGRLNRIIQRLRPDTLNAWMVRFPELSEYRFFYENLFHSHALILTSDEENLLSCYDLFSQSPEAIFQALHDSDQQLPWMVLENGDSVALSNNRLNHLFQIQGNRVIRQNAWQIYHGPLISCQNTYAQIYQAVCQRDWANARVRGFSSSLDAALDRDNVPVEVYKNLIDAARSNTAPLKRYHRLRKTWLHTPQYSMIDTRLHLISTSDTLSYPSARDGIIASADMLGLDFQNKVTTLFSHPWIDVYPCSDKRSGAYSFTLYGQHPYLLLNYENGMQDAVILAHETGHAIHGMLSDENQPVSTSQVATLTAEIASTMQEQIFLNHRLSSTQEPLQQIILLQLMVENQLDNFYGASMEADFEWQAHGLIEQGETINDQVLNDLMTSLYQEYYGDALDMDTLTSLHWMRMQHFYKRPFYLFQYAVSHSLSTVLYSNIQKADDIERIRMIECYLSMLKAGGSDYPMNLIRMIDVDLLNTDIYEQVVNHIDTLIDQLETLYNEIENKSSNPDFR